MKEQLKKLAKQILLYSLKIKEKENLLIEVIGKDGIPLAKEIMIEAQKLNVNTFFNIIDYSLLKSLLANANEDQIKLYAKHDLSRMKDMDAYVGISSKKCENEFLSIPLEKMQMYNKYYISKVHLEERLKKKWCILRYPNSFFAKKNKMTLKEAKNYYFNVCNMDYEKMSNAMNALVDMLNKTDKVRITGVDTELTFSIKGIKAEKYVGNFNLPDGEVATAPIKTSVNGYITYNTQSIYNGIAFNNIRFEFKDGKIIKATSNHSKELNEILDTDEGSRFIGEFAFGLNPYILNVSGDTLFDEKVCGSFHFTPGEALKESDNGNRSAIHWDIVNIQTEKYGGGEIWLDNTLIRKNGRFVSKNLQPLNPENLRSR